MPNAFEKFLTVVGKEFEKALSYVLPLATAAAPVVAIADPALAPAYSAVTNVISNVVVTVEQKFAAMGKQTGTGAQKLADAVTIVTPAVEQILSSAGIAPNAALITTWTNAVVALLNALPYPVKAAA